MKKKSRAKSHRSVSPWFNCRINPVGKKKSNEAGYECGLPTIKPFIKSTDSERVASQRRLHNHDKIRISTQRASYLKDMSKAGL